MVWSKWKTAVALAVTGAGVAWAGLAWTQQPAATTTIVPSDKIMTYQEMGKAPQHLVILKSWVAADGSHRKEVQNTATQEVFEMLDPPGGTPQRSIQQVNHVHSGDGSRLVPVPADGSPMPSQAPVTAAFTPGHVRTIQEVGKPAMKARVMVSWRTETGMQAAQCEVVDTGEKLTLVETGPAATVPGAPNQQMKAVAMRIIHWGKNGVSPPGAPLPPSEMPGSAVGNHVNPLGPCNDVCQVNPIMVPAQTACGPCNVGETVTQVPASPGRAPLGSRIASVLGGRGQSSPQVVVVPADTHKVSTPAPLPALTNNVVSPAIEAPTPTDWRHSWGTGAKAPPPPVTLPPMPTKVASVPGVLSPYDRATEPEMPPPPVVPEATAKAAPIPPPFAKLPEAPPPVAVPVPPAKVEVAKAKPDPLSVPEAFVSKKVEDKYKDLPPLPAQLANKPSAPLTPPATTGTGKMPLGAASVLEASNGLNGPIRYVPVPVVTTPQAKAPPLPPVPQMPEAPQANQFVNAFSPPADPNAQQNQQMAMMQGYNPNMMRPPMMPQYNPYQMQQMQQMQMQQMMAMGYNPYAGQQPMMPQYNPRTGQPMTYMGPQPPNPAYAPPMQPRPMMAMNGTGWSPVAYNAAMDRRVPVTNAAQADTVNELIQMMTVLKTSLYPAQREWAANNLAMFDYRSHPEVVIALVVAAKEDPAPTVRAGCVGTLAKMNANVEPVVATLNTLKTDADPRVRSEATTALSRFGAAQPQMATQPPTLPSPGAMTTPVMPVRGTLP